jgi:AbrB family looped-hinge helix DNA binding protein
MSEAVAVRIDRKGRLTIPLKDREALGVTPGSTVWVQREGNTLHVTRAENPLDGLALYAIEEDRAGRTRSLRDIAREAGLSVDGE